MKEWQAEFWIQQQWLPEGSMGLPLRALHTMYVQVVGKPWSPPCTSAGPWEHQAEAKPRDRESRMHGGQPRR